MRTDGEARTASHLLRLYKPNRFVLIVVGFFIHRHSRAGSSHSTRWAFETSRFLAQRHATRITGVDIEALAEALTTRLDTVAPQALRVRLQNGIIGVLGVRGWSGGQGTWEFDNERRSPEERLRVLEQFCWVTISGVQDQIVREIHALWPEPLGRSLPLPFVTADFDLVRLGFRERDEERAALELEPIPFSEFAFELPGLTTAPSLSPVASAMARVQADVRSTTDLDVELRAIPTATTSRAPDPFGSRNDDQLQDETGTFIIDGEVRAVFDFPNHLDAEGTCALAADYVQDVVPELADDVTWPTCPYHEHPLNPKTNGFEQASWVCPRLGEVISPIGELRLEPRERQ